MNSNRYGNVASGHAQVSNIAMEILRAGGNAFDAATAAVLSSTLCEPMLGSLGGGGLLLAKTKDDQFRFFDFFVNFPGLGRSDLNFDLTPVDVQFGSASQTFYIGPHSICPPGVLSGLIHAHKELGFMPLKDIVQPVIHQARQGVEIDHIQGYVIRILYPIMVQSPKGEELFTKNGELIRAGDTFRNPEFGDYLETLPDSLGRDIYEGELGEKFISSMDGESLLTSRDLKEYQTIERSPKSYEYRANQIYTAPLPALGGIMMTALLDGMAHHDLAQFKWGSPEHISELAQVMVSVENNKELLLSNRFTKGTTHISVSDTKGNCVALSMSNGQGSGYYVPGTGIMMNNMLGEDDLFDATSAKVKPGERIPSMMSPTLLMRDDKKIFAMGSGGSKRIRSSLMQTVSNLADFNLPLDKAISNSRINWDGELFQIEKGYSDECVAAIKEKFPVNEWPDIAFYFGGVHCVELGGVAHGDPRRGGCGLAE